MVLTSTEHPLKVIYKKVSDLKPYENNARTHSDEQIDQLAESMRTFGFTNPMLVDDKGIIAGHGRLMAAQRAGLTEVPTIELTGMSDKDRRAYILLDNQSAINADWDEEKLGDELLKLLNEDYDISIIGFEDDYLADLLDVETEGLTDEDEVPEVEDDPISKLGDIWVLGRHRLLCGDSTSKADVEKLMDGQKADMVFTDPPYGMSYGGGRARGNHALNKETGGVLIKAHGMIIGDDLKGDDLLEMVRDAISNAINVNKKKGAAYICFTWRTYAEFQKALIDVKLTVKACIVWDKKSIGLGRSHYRPQHEFIFYCNGDWYGDKSQSDVWYMSRGATGEYVHPTQKPVELIERALKNSSKINSKIYDCFGGSGSTLIACEKTNRICYMVELDEKYVDVIIKRWQFYTGKNATRNNICYNDIKSNE